MNRAALLGVAFLVACAHEGGNRETPAEMRQGFTSAAAVLIDFDFDATLITDTNDPAAIDRLIHAQLMFSTGQLNGESSVGRLERAEDAVKNVTALSTSPPTFAVDYHAKLPVAWGGAPPAAYTLILPARVSDADQAAFAKKYAGACTDPEESEINAGDMFLFYRPRQAGCVLDPADVVQTAVAISASNSNTTGKYPEYHRVWDDDELDFVAIFGREFDDGRADDDGVRAYRSFVDRTREALRTLQPDAALRPEDTDPDLAEPNVRLTATTNDGWRIRVDVLSTRPSLAVDPVVDTWYDARSADADAIVYSGHAGLGDNVRSLMGKGVFRPQKYVVLAVNGCDTFAYVDSTLATRRAVLNPDDPGGTRYMDTVTNVLGAYFHSGAATASELLDALVSAAQGSPKTYRDIFSAVDPTQIIVVDGEQDNEFAPGMMPPAPGPVASPPPKDPAPRQNEVTEASKPPARAVTGGSMAGGGFRCNLEPRDDVDATWGVAWIGLTAFVMACRRSARQAHRRRVA